MKKGPDWGWWRRSDAPPQVLREIVADWMEQQGQTGWARWFRDVLDQEARFLRFFGDGQGAGSASSRVLVGAFPSGVPTTDLDGPWFRTLHVLRATERDAPELAELADVPCMARLENLVVHDARPDQRRTELPPLDLRLLGPVADTLTALWSYGPIRPESLDVLPHLHTLAAPLRDGRYAHPGIRSLATQVEGTDFELALPALERIDLEFGSAPIHTLLRQIPTVRSIELEAPDLLAVSQAHQLGMLPALERCAVWGRSTADLGEVAITWESSITRSDIRVTSPWIFDRALLVAI